MSAIDPATLRLGPPPDYPDQATIDAAVEAFLTTYPAGTPDEQGRTGLRRDLAAALRSAYGPVYVMPVPPPPDKA